LNRVVKRCQLFPAIMSFLDEDDESLEHTLFTHKECLVYNIPPLADTRGHKAADWRELIFTGRIRLTAKGPNGTLYIEDAASGELFVSTEVLATGPKTLEPVTDSSRYYVLRVAFGGKAKYIGLGFTDRGPAFDFMAAYNDHMSYTERQKVLEEKRRLAATQPAAPARDMSLSGSITIKMGGKGGEGGSAPRATGGPIPILAPPPAAGGFGLAPPPSGGGRQRNRPADAGAQDNSGGFF
jgi:adaptin ear-binding coat-associated protein 1/2